MTNGHAMSSTHPEMQRYMRLFAHLPILLTEQPLDVLVICFGVGTTLHAASLHPELESLEVVDLSKHVLRHARYFEASNDDVLADPRVSVFVNDGRQHLRMQPARRYDLITLEPPPIGNAGVAALYSTEFYELARSRIRPGGYMTQWLPAHRLPGHAVLSIVRAFLDVFPDATLHSGAGRELILMGSTAGGNRFEPRRVARRLRANPSLHADLMRIHAGSTTALAATFAAGPAALARATRDVPPVTDDLPITEYSRPSAHLDVEIPEALFDRSELWDWCPDCARDGDLPLLEPLLELLEAHYRSVGFRRFSTAGAAAAPGRSPRVEALLRRDPCLAAHVRAQPYLSQLFARSLARVPSVASPESCPASPGS